jgi:hypothetical protein
MFEKWVTQTKPRPGPKCERCGATMVATRIEPHPDGEARALLCSYECRCGFRIARKEN